MKFQQMGTFFKQNREKEKKYSLFNSLKDLKNIPKLILNTIF